MNIVVNEIDISWFTHHFSRARVAQLDVITSIAQWIWRSHRPSEARCKCVKIVLTISTCVKIQKLCNLRELLCALSMVILVIISLIASQVHPIQYSLCNSMIAILLVQITGQQLSIFSQENNVTGYFFENMSVICNAFSRDSISIFFMPLCYIPGIRNSCKTCIITYGDCARSWCSGHG